MDKEVLGAEVLRFRGGGDALRFRIPQSSEFGTHHTVKARFWPRL